MDKTTTKILLAAYRPGSYDARDPVFRDALELVEQEPELAAWFRAEQEFDAVMIETFREVPVDSAIRERIQNALRREAEDLRNGK